MTSTNSYRARLRFRVLTPLTIPEKERDVLIAGRTVRLSSDDDKTPIQESNWLVLNARDFGTEEEARDFGDRLRRAVEFASASARLGVDVGVDRPTSGLGLTCRNLVQQKQGIDVRPNIHGLDIFPDDATVRFFRMSAQGTVTANPDAFFETMDRLHPAAEKASKRVRDAVLLLNYALMRPEPVATIVFAVSAVEMLGQDLEWSEPQKRLLKHLADSASQSVCGTQTERDEVAGEVRKLHRLSLRQGVVRLLDRLMLSGLKKPWDDLYSLRSKLMHAGEPTPGVDYSDLARRTVDLCGWIILKAVANEVPGSDTHLGSKYPTPTMHSGHSEALKQ